MFGLVFCHLLLGLHPPEGSSCGDGLRGLGLGGRCNLGGDGALGGGWCAQGGAIAVVESSAGGGRWRCAIVVAGGGRRRGCGRGGAAAAAAEATTQADEEERRRRAGQSHQDQAPGQVLAHENASRPEPAGCVFGRGLEGAEVSPCSSFRVLGFAHVVCRVTVLGRVWVLHRCSFE